MLFDSHIHFQDERIFPQFKRLLEDAFSSNIKGWICCGSSPDDWSSVSSLCAKESAILPAFGLHPWYVDEAGEDWSGKLMGFLDAEPSAIGEIGLDYALNVRNDQLQEKVFRMQMDIAKKRGLPVSIHCRKAWDIMPAIIEEYACSGFPIILHSFSGPVELIPRLSKAGCYFSFSGSITRSNNKKGNAALLTVPKERLLLETDAPDLPPVVDHKVVEPNIPANLVHVAQTVAEKLKLDSTDLEEIIWNNSMSVFGDLLKKRENNV